MNRMNLPNKLTLLRVLMIPFFIIFLMMPLINENILANPVNDYIAFGIFVVASLTDLIDGKIARARNLVTNFGKFMDPLADKLLVCSALICLIELQRISAWMVIVIIAREFIISGFRLIAADKGVVIAASYWGKFKTTFQMIGVCMLILNIEVFKIATSVVMWIAVILTVVSLIDYLIKNRDVMRDN